METMPKIVAVLTLFLAAAGTSARAGEKVVLRASGGQFLRPAGGGTVLADRLFPAERETFELLSSEGDSVSLRTHDGRVVLVHGVRGAAGREDPDGPRPAVEIYRAGEVPSTVRSALPPLIVGLVVQKLDGEEYDKIESRRKKKYIELPAPTLRDPGRKKKHRVLSYREEYRVQARRAGEPEVRITHMPHLKGHFDRGSSVLMFVVEASIPVKGRVNYKIPDRLSASTGFTTTVELSMVGEVRVEKSKDRVSVKPPEVLDIRIALRGLDLSNDLLNAARRPIEDVINRQIRKKNARIRQQANETLSKAVEAREFRHPFLRFVTLP